MKINIIVRNEKNLVEDLVSLKYDSKKFKNFNMVSEYLQKKYKKKCEYYECEYDIECKKEYIYCLTKKNKSIDLDIDFSELEFEEYYRITKTDTLTINSVRGSGGIGAVEEIIKILEILIFLWSLLKNFINLIKSLLVYFFPFYNIKKEYDYGKNFICDIILKSENWNYGFLNLEKIKFKKLLEKSIMRKLGYELKNKKWVSGVMCSDVYRNLNKYDNY